MADAPVLFFDGHCNLCNGAVNFVLDRERGSTLKFAALQSSSAAELLARVVGAERTRELREGAGDAPGSMLLLEGGRLYSHSTAVVRSSRYLRAPWSWGIVLLLVPRFLRDVVYRFVARRRYRWFGKSDTCRVPTPELRARFLS